MGILGGQSRSPVKESSYLARTVSVDEVEGEGEEGEKEVGKKKEEKKVEEMSSSPSPIKDGLPIRG